jgi:hypothetical protein
MPASPLLAAVLICAFSAALAVAEAAAQSQQTLPITYAELDEAVTKSGYVVAHLEPVSASGPRETRRVIRIGERNVEVFAVAASSPQFSSSPDFVYLWFAPVNGGDEDNKRSFGVVADVLQRVFPNWDDVASWVINVSQDAWERSGRYLKGQPISDEDRVISTRRNDSWIDVYGMLPDLFIYVVTTRPECRLGATFMKRQANPCLPDPSNP